MPALRDESINEIPQRTRQPHQHSRQSKDAIQSAKHPQRCRGMSPRALTIDENYRIRILIRKAGFLQQRPTLVRLQWSETKDTGTVMPGDKVDPVPTNAARTVKQDDRLIKLMHFRIGSHAALAPLIH
jgi:hypothetical protein